MSDRAKTWAVLLSILATFVAAASVARGEARLLFAVAIVYHVGFMARCALDLIPTVSRPEEEP
jgi:hypothetical protein